MTRAGTVYLLRGFDEQDIALDGDATAIVGLLRLLDGTRSADEVAREAGVDDPDLVLQAIDELVELGVVEDAAQAGGLDPREADRYARQLTYFGDVLGGAGAAARAQARLRAATVCILGMGGLGSWAAWALACCGVGRIVGVDGDRVELSNLNRQILYAEQDAGRPKAEAAGRLLRAFDGALEYEPVDARLDSPEAVAGVVRGADFVVNTADWPPHLMDRWVSAACFGAGVPYIAVSQHPPHLRIGPTYVPGETGCFACSEVRWRRDYPLYGELEEADAPLPPPSATFGPACGAVGALAANEAIAHLAGLGRPATAGAALFVDLRTFAVRREEVHPAPGCPVCGGAVADAELAA